MVAGTLINRPGIREHSRWDKELTEDLVFYHPTYGTIVASMGFRCDLASIRALRDGAVFLAYVALVASYCFNPTTVYLAAGFAVLLLTLYATLAGYGDVAAALHDWCYRKAKELGLTREQCDEIFWLALRATHHAKWRAGIFYWGVRALAWGAWRKYQGK